MKIYTVVIFVLWCIFITWVALFGFSKPFTVAVLLSIATFFIISTLYREHKAMKEYLKRIRLNLESTDKKQAAF